MFDNNFGQFGQISKFFHQLIRKKIQHKEFHSSVKVDVDVSVVSDCVCR